MNDDELDRLLRAANVPERPADHWSKFLRKVKAELRNQKLRKRRGRKGTPRQQ